MMHNQVDIFSFLLVALAVYRVARMLALEDGPVEIFAKWRYWLGQKSWVGRGFHCPLCISFWLGFMSAWLLNPAGPVWYVVVALALSGVTVFLVGLEK